ncbi:MAG TPA: T9SS type A sorting domain-containing protein [Chitinophagales bacterium]|jgi:hypothetical protein|nr:T9SS type A sorting domain-containing protein [Chitinophagales bacterium]
MRIADRLRQEFASGPSFLFPSLSIWNGFKIYRQNSPGLTKVNCFSTKPLLNFVFIRPNNTTPRRCILLTNGAGEDLGSNWGGTLLLAANLVMRGYAVVIYENFVSSNGIAHYIAANGSAWKYPCGSNMSCLITDTEPDKFRKLIYSGVQCGIAALQTIMDNTNNASVTNVDTSKIYAMGASFGGITSLAFANADDDASYGNVNFSNSVFSPMGGFTNISRWPNSRYKNVIKAVTCFGGGTFINDEVVGNLFDNNDVPVIFFHALKDSLCTIDSSKNLISPLDGRNILAENNLIGGPAKLDVIQALKDNNIKYNVVINCDTYGAHAFGSGYGQANNTLYDFNSVKSLTNTEILNLYTNPTSNPTNTAAWKRYMYVGFQFLSFTNTSCKFFNDIATAPNNVANMSIFVKPVSQRNANADANGDFFPPASNISNLTPNGLMFSYLTNYPPLTQCNQSPCIDIPLTPIYYPSNQNTSLRKSNNSNKYKGMNILQSEEIEQINAFPNPTSDLLNISFKIENQNNFTLKIVDINGKEIEILYNNTSLENGIYTLKINTSNYSNGFYYVTFSSGNTVKTKPFSILKQ